MQKDLPERLKRMTGKEVSETALGPNKGDKEQMVTVHPYTWDAHLSEENGQYAVVFLHLLENIHNAGMRMPDRFEKMAAMLVLDYIEHHYKDGTLTEICEMLGLPMHSLSRMIKRTIGFNYKELLQRKRIVKAVRLLCDTDMPISDIVREVGYENNSYFHRVFRERYHMTPRDFRAKKSKNRQIRL